MRDSQTQKGDLREQLALDILDTCPKWYIDIDTREDGCITSVVLQASRPSSRMFGKGAELFELTWRASRAGVGEDCRATHIQWTWTRESRWTAELPSLSENVRKEFVRRATRATADDALSEREAALRDRAVKLLNGENVSPCDPSMRADYEAALRARFVGANAS